jgi:hypothetical protein
MSDTKAHVATKAMGAVAPSKVIDPMVEFWAHGKRTPVYRRPDEVGLQYEDVFFPSMDGVALEGGFIPADSDRLIIHNHFLPGNRYGYAGHLEGLRDFGGFEVIGELLAGIHGSARRRLQHFVLRHPQSRSQRRRQRPYGRHRSARVPGCDRLDPLREVPARHRQHDHRAVERVSGC